MLLWNRQQARRDLVDQDEMLGWFESLSSGWKERLQAVTAD